MIYDSITQKLLFNPDGDDSIETRTMIGGNSTNLLNLNNVKYTWAKDMYREMSGNVWFPEKVDLSKDKLQFTMLDKYDKNAYEHYLSFLTFMDSVQTNNIPNIFAYITAPEVTILGAIQTFQEAIHSVAYSYLFETVVEPQRRQEIFYMWRTNKELLHRNKHIAKVYQDFIDKPNTFNFFRALLANYILENIYFYNGFIFFYNLEYRNTMLGSADNIRYINRDEASHGDLFRAIIMTIIEENKLDFDWKNLAYEMTDASVKEEIHFHQGILQNRIIGMSDSTVDSYTKNLGNNNLIGIGLQPLYIGVKNPYEYLKKGTGDDQNGQKGNFFESTMTNYSNAATLSGWDDL